MQRIQEDIRSSGHEILRRWSQQAEALPWMREPMQHWDHLPMLIEALADEALVDPAPEGCVRRLIEAAVEHGRDRRREGAQLDDVFGDYYRLRTAIWLYLQDRPYPSDAVSRALLMLDRAITSATSASLVGFHAPEVEIRGGGMMAAIDRLTKHATPSPIAAADSTTDNKSRVTRATPPSRLQ